MTDLKPCPFCGKTEISLESGNALCDACGAWGPDARNREEAIAPWNTRPLEDALAAERDAARAEVERLQKALQSHEEYRLHESMERNLNG